MNSSNRRSFIGSAVITRLVVLIVASGISRVCAQNGEDLAKELLRASAESKLEKDRRITVNHRTHEAQELVSHCHELKQLITDCRTAAQICEECGRVTKAWQHLHRIFMNIKRPSVSFRDDWPLGLLRTWSAFVCHCQSSVL